MNSELKQSSAAIKGGGWSLVAAAAGFIAVFSYLAVRFNYPDILDGAASQVLPRLLELGDAGRLVWAIYAALPFLLIPAGIGVHAATKHAAPNAARGALILAVLAAFTMFLGLARWPTVHWALASAYAGGSADVQTTVAAIFDGLNVYLGNYIGEFVGEAALNGFFVLTSIAALRTSGVARWFAFSGVGVGVAGWIGAFRNVTHAVSYVAEINNYLLPMWLIALGVTLIRWRVPPMSRAIAERPERRTEH